ncbi:cytochrome [Chromatiales bacterium (ex Bugula neritina AB1)]|nr:cytochrome [Chromatiales bacterium (ex Bugula neritina AB1)]
MVDIDPATFQADPYPVYAQMRQQTPICYVPQLGATLLTLRDDIFECEKNVGVFSSVQPGGLMTVLMGENMMRKDGEAHVIERRQAMPSLSPRTVRRVWKKQFELATEAVLDSLSNRDTCDLVQDYAMPVSANALRYITGLTNMTPAQLDACSQGMIDGIANYSGDADIQSRCNEATAFIDRSIDEMLLPQNDLPEYSLLQVLCAAGQPMDSVRANIKLAISGGQNEPRDAIAGAAWALLTHPQQLTGVLDMRYSWRSVFEEYARWISPIGMSPRQIARAFEWKGVNFESGGRAFLMFGSANRDETAFDQPELFNLDRDTSKAVSFGAGPHFCAGASASRVLIGEVALPRLFERFPDLALDGEVTFSGWAFRGPLTMPVRLR